MEYTIGILSGGKSSRMGANKAFLKYSNEESFLQRAILAACKESKDVLVSVDDISKYANLIKGFESKGVKIVEDERKAYGPLEGIYRILKAAKNDYCFIFAVDMPFVDENFLKSFFLYSSELKSNADCIAVKSTKREPLCALYNKSIATHIEEMFERDEHKVGMLLEDTNITIEELDVNELGFAEKTFENINTPDDYKKMLTFK